MSTVPELVEFRVANADGIAWASDQTFNVPRATLADLGLADAIQDGRLSLPSTPLQGAGEAAARLRLLAAFTDRKPVSSRLPFPYHWVPAQVRMWIARRIGALRRGELARAGHFPRWPLDLSADLLADLAGATPPATKTPVILSHDLDSEEGLRNLVDRFLPLEESVGARSTSFVVPFKWPLDHGLLAETRSRRHELGVHGFDHGNRTPFLAPAEQRERFNRTRPLIEKYGMVGYRAPSLLRTRALLNEVKRIFQYDSSVPTSGGLFPVPGNGCATARPFSLDGLTEIPLSMPRDGSLLFLGHRPHEIAELWLRCARLIARSRGVVVLLTHCEDHFTGQPEMLAAYRHTLEALRDDGQFRFVTGADLTSEEAWTSTRV